MLNRRRPAGDAGTTLAELMVCMAITTVVGAIALSFFVWTGRTTRATAENSFTGQTARTSLSTLSALLRLALPGSVTSGYAGVTTLTADRVAFAVSDTPAGACADRPAAAITVRIAQGAVWIDRTGPRNAPTPSRPCAFTAGVVSSVPVVSNVVSGTRFAYTYRSLAGAASTDPARVMAVTTTLVVQGLGTRSQTLSATSVISGGAG